MTIAVWNAQKTVNTTKPGIQDQPRITQLADGSMVVVWTDHSAGNNDVKFQRYDALGNSLGTETLAHGASAADQATSDVIALSTGEFVVSWVDTQGNTFSAQKFTAAGVAVGGPLTLSNPALLTGNLELYPPVITAMPNGEYVAVYHTGSNGGDLVGRIVNAAGVAGPAFDIATTLAGDQFNPAVSVANNTIVVVWSDLSLSGSDSSSYAVRMRSFDLTGVGFPSSGGGPGQDSVVNDITPGPQYAPSVAHLGLNVFVVNWTDESGAIPNTGANLRGQIVDSDGNHLGNAFTVNAGFNNQLFHKTVTLSNGGFMVVYETSLNSGEILKAQMFNAEGAVVGSAFTLSTSGKQLYTIPDVVTLADGRVAVVWDDNAADSGNNGDSIGIAMQILDPRDGFFSGSANADKIYGHDGNVDFITGGDGADTIYGLRGNDTIYGDAGSDLLYDGRGDDNVYGGADGDYLYGDLGDDQLFGGDGNDSIYSFGGADLMDGGAGTGDSVFYVNERSAVTINLVDQILNAGAAFGDTIVNIERIYGVVYFANNLTGDNNSNILVGGIQSDILSGGGGFDILRGGLGADTMTGGTSGDYFQYTAVAEGGDTITDWAAGDKFTFARAAFGNLAGANVAAVNFLSVASGHVATTAAQKFIFDQATDQLWYDADGSAGGAAVMIADLSTNVNLLNTDLLLA
jgi:Ca2+-binding RTX toxin-like protein